MGNHVGITSQNFLTDPQGILQYNSTTYTVPVANRLALMSNNSAVIYSTLSDTLSSITASNTNTTIASSILAESDPSLTAAAYSVATEVKKFDMRSNFDQSNAYYYRYQKMAEFVATEDGSYNFSMSMKTDLPAVAWRAILCQNDLVVESTSLSQVNVPNQIAEWNALSMSNGYAANAWAASQYQVHTVSAKNIKKGDVIRVWMSPSFNSGAAYFNSSLDTNKALYLKDFVVNKIYSKGKNFLTVNGTEVGTAIGNLNGLTSNQRLTIGLGQNYFNGVVHEVLVYNRALTKQERETVEAYLYKRWTGNIIPAANHSWNLPIDSVSSGIHPALPSEGGYTASAQINTISGYPFFRINENPNVALSTVENPYAARILGSQYGDFLGGGTGSAGYWAEWAEGSTASRQNWAASLTAAGSRHALLNYSTSSEFRKITAEAFFDQKVGLQFDCKNELIVEPPTPRVRLTYCLDFPSSTVYSNGTVIFNYSIENAPNMEYWITDQMEVEVSDGRKLYRYRPENNKWKNNTAYGQFAISGFTSNGTSVKSYIVTFRLLNYYGKVIPESQISISFGHKYASLPSATNSLENCTGSGIGGYTGSTEEATTVSFRFATLATGVPSEPGQGDDLPTGLDPLGYQQYWKDKIKERDHWFWQIGKDDQMPLFRYSEDCDPLGLGTFFRPGSDPFALPVGDPFYPRIPYTPPGGPNYHIPSDIPPDGMEPRYVNDNHGGEIYYYENHWWIRSIDPVTGVVTWRFKVPKSSPDNWGYDGFANPSDGWTTFVPCYGVPVCIYPQTSDNDSYTPSPATFDQPLYLPPPGGEDLLPNWGDPFNYPPGMYEGQPNPYNVPSDNPIAPFGQHSGKGWRPRVVPAGTDSDGNPYRGRGWDPVFGPYYIDDRGIRPYGYGGVDAADDPNSQGFIRDKNTEHPPCKNNGSPGINIPIAIESIQSALSLVEGNLTG